LVPEGDHRAVSKMSVITDLGTGLSKKERTEIRPFIASFISMVYSSLFRLKNEYYQLIPAMLHEKG
jgi:hypothetical protein